MAQAAQGPRPNMTTIVVNGKLQLVPAPHSCWQRHKEYGHEKGQMAITPDYRAAGCQGGARPGCRLGQATMLANAATYDVSSSSSMASSISSSTRSLIAS